MAKDADTYVLPAIMLVMAGFLEGKSALKGRKARQTPGLGTLRYGYSDYV